MRELILDASTYWRKAPVREARLLVDACDYYAAFYQAALKAERTLLLSGWQFDTEVELLRGQDAAGATLPLRLLEFLNALCEQKPSLHVYILAWDYSIVYALEREFLQSLKVAMRKHERVHFEYWTHPEPGGAHHHKYVVVDDCVAFVGGLDLCDARWDTRAHRKDDELRVDCTLRGHKPFHDTQVAVTGPLALDLRDLFSYFWQQTSGPNLKPSTTGREPPKLADICDERGLPLRAESAALSRTEFGDGTATVCEVEQLFVKVLEHAEHSIYIESQYFTSRAMLQALQGRLRAADRGKLILVIVMPHGADTPKEDFVLGSRQRAVRFALTRLAEEHGHDLRILYSADRSDPDNPMATFIHSKVLIVDDEFMSIGSANLTNRSMQVDTELNLSVLARPGSPLAEDIQMVRASLLAEHAGHPDVAWFRPSETIIRRIDQACDDPNGKLCCHDIEPPSGRDPLLTAVFDPSGELTVDVLEQALDLDGGAFRKMLRKVGQRLGAVDID